MYQHGIKTVKKAVIMSYVSIALIFKLLNYIVILYLNELFKIIKY